MNAPWKSGLVGSRDIIAAHISDDASLEAVRSAVVEQGWQNDKCVSGGLPSAVHALSVAPSPSILIVDLSESDDALADIHRLAEVCEPGTIVLTIGHLNDVKLYRDLLTSGIHDYLLKPLSPDTLSDALTQAQSILAAQKAAALEDASPHVGTAIVGLRGGVGASTIATSLAWLFSTEHNVTTALLDLDVHFGTVALTLDLEPGRGLTDAIESPDRIDSLFLERAMIRAADKLSLLSAEAPIHSPLATDGEAFVRLENEFRTGFDASVIDLPRHVLVNHPELAVHLGVVVLVAELTLASARDAIRLLAWFRTNAPDARVIIVANKVPSHPTEISAADFEASIERKIDLSIPYDLKVASHAAKLGQTLAESNKTGKPGLVLRELSQKVLGTSNVDAVDPSAKQGLLGKFDLKSLLAKKDKAAPAMASR